MANRNRLGGKVSIAHPNPIEQVKEDNEHARNARRRRFSEIGREIPTHERAHRHRSYLLSAFRRRARMATGIVVQRRIECEPRDFKHAAHSRP